LQKIENYNREDIYKEFHQVSGFNILYVGGLDKGKRLDVLIRAFAALYEKYGKDVALHIVGKGRMLEELKQQGCPNIFFHGQVIDDVNRYFLGADVFVLPGLGGLAISEAMSHGLPVIASIGDGCELDLIDNTNGILDPQLNEDKLFRYLDDLYRDKNKLKDMKEASLRKIKEQYNTQEYLVNFRGAIDFVVAG
jgi:glycosyltransferase involved in cell wall biosynthesis